MIEKLENKFGDGKAKITIVFNFINKVCKLILRRNKNWATRRDLDELKME